MHIYHHHSVKCLSWFFHCVCHSLQYPFHADAHKRDTKNLVHVAINTLEAQNHVCKGYKEGLTKKPSMASLLGESFAVGTGEGLTRSGENSAIASFA